MLLKLVSCQALLALLFPVVHIVLCDAAIEAAKENNVLVSSPVQYIFLVSFTVT